MKKLGMRNLGRLLAIGAMAMAMAGPAQAANVDLVTNGGFETGDFTGWTQTGQTTFNGVFCPGPGPNVFQGNCSAFFGPVGATGGISQVINVGEAGLRWHLFFWLQTDGANPSSFSASFGGETLDSFPLNNPPAASTLYHFSGTTTAAAETLAFDFRDDLGFIFLDGVQLLIPEPATMALLGAGLMGLFFSRRRKPA